MIAARAITCMRDVAFPHLNCASHAHKPDRVARVLIERRNKLIDFVARRQFFGHDRISKIFDVQRAEQLDPI
jgi:hypothetical protein